MKTIRKKDVMAAVFEIDDRVSQQVKGAIGSAHQQHLEWGNLQKAFKGIRDEWDAAGEQFDKHMHDLATQMEGNPDKDLVKKGKVEIVAQMKTLIKAYQGTKDKFKREQLESRIMRLGKVLESVNK